MFDIFFGWRKASKCKSLVRRVQCRLKFLKIKRDSIVMQIRDEIAQLLKNGHSEIAFSRVEQLFKDQSLLAAYDLLEYFCEFIITHFPYIRKHKDCPNDINEAVSTLIFAAAWCGDLPELQMIQKLFAERYGHKFAKAAVELCPGTLVNSQIREKLCMKSIPENVTSRLMYEIAKDYNLPRELLGCDNRSETHLTKLCRNSGCQWEGFIFKEQAQVNYNSLGGVEIPSRLAYKSSLGSCSSKKLSVSLEDKAEPGSTAAALLPSEISAYQFHKSIVNFQEVEEVQFNTLQDQCREDKRTFLFNLSIFPLPNRSCGEHSSNRPGPWNVTACIGKYYEETFNFSQGQKFICHQSGHGDKHPRMMPDQVDGSSLFVCNEKLWSPQKMHICCKKMQRHIMSSQCKCKCSHRKSFCRCRFSQEMELNCSLEQPCYYSVLESRNDILVEKCRKLGKEAQVSDFLGSFASCSRESSPNIEPKPLKRSSNSSHSHVHPKLPDYDELAAKFKALKKEHQQRIAKGSQGLK